MRKCLLCGKKDVPGNGTFFTPPKNTVMMRKWVELCKVMEFNTCTRICIDHFLTSDIINVGRYTRLLPRAMPIVPEVQQSNVPSNSSDLRCIIGSEVNPNCMSPTTNLQGHRFFLIKELTSTASDSEKKESQTENIRFLNVASDKQFLVGELIKPAEENNLSTGPDEHYVFKIQNTPFFYVFKRQNTNYFYLFSSYIEIVLKEYQEKISKLESENKELRFQLLQANAALDSMKKPFIEGQVRSLITPDVKWKWLDVSNDICLHTASPREYRHMYNKGFALPHVTTLQRWCHKIDAMEVVLHKALEFMRQTTHLSLEEKISFLTFDEIKVEETFEYDAVNDMVRKSENCVQEVMARDKMTTEILNAIITQFCDMDPTNRRLLQELGVTPESVTEEALKLLQDLRRTMEMHPQEAPQPSSPETAGFSANANLPTNACGGRSLIQTKQDKRLVMSANAPQSRILASSNILACHPMAGPLHELQIVSPTIDRIKVENEQQETNTTSPAKKSKLEDINEFVEQQRMRKQIAGQYGDDNYEVSNKIYDDTIHYDDDQISTGQTQTAQTSSTSPSAGVQTLPSSFSQQQQQSEDPPSAITIIIKYEGPDKPPSIVVKDNFNLKMDHAKIIFEFLRQYKTLVQSYKITKLVIMPNAGGQAPNIIVEKGTIEAEKLIQAPATKSSNKTKIASTQQQSVKTLASNLVANLLKTVQQAKPITIVKTLSPAAQTATNIVTARSSTSSAATKLYNKLIPQQLSKH